MSIVAAQTSDDFSKQFQIITINGSSEAKFKEFEPRLKYGWFHLKLYSIFQDLSRLLIETGFWQIKAAAQIH